MRVVQLFELLAVLACACASPCGKDGQIPELICQDYEPQQVHIAFAGVDDLGNSNSMAVSWNTKIKTDTSVVKYGTTSGQYDFTSVGSASAYYKSLNHHVTLDTLKPDTKYYYICGDEASGMLSKELSFKSAPLSSDAASHSDWSFAFFADLGVVNGGPSSEYVGHMVNSSDGTSTNQNNRDSNGIELVWHGGDIGYADDSFTHYGCYTKFCYEKVYDEYMVSAAQHWTTKVPYMVTPGNHEAECHSPACLLVKERREKLSNFTAYNERFHMPSEESGGVLNMHYSWNYKNVHFISIDTETGYKGAPEAKRMVLKCGGFGDQLTWLENDLIEANKPENRAVRPWIFMAGHRPIYYGSTVHTELQTAIEGLMYKYGVDMYLYGHVHNYQRLFPVYNSIVDPAGYNNPKATTMVLVGSPGNDEMDPAQRKRVLQQELERDAASSEEKPADPSPKDTALQEGGEGDPWVAVTDGAKDNSAATGVSKITVHSDTKLTFEYFHSTSGELFDSFTLTREHAAGTYPLK